MSFYYLKTFQLKVFKFFTPRFLASNGPSQFLQVLILLEAFSLTMSDYGFLLF